jgi:preprotein translocase subunit SecD
MGVMARRLARLGVPGVVVRAQGDDIVVEMPKPPVAIPVLAVLGQPGQLAFRPVDCIITPYSGARHAPAVPALSANATSAGTSGMPGICRLSAARQAGYLPPHGDGHGDTPEAYDTKDATVVLSYRGDYVYGRYVLGPAEMTGSIVKAATAVLNSQTRQWEVVLRFTPAGSAQFNGYAARHYACYAREEQDPPYCALEAIDLDATLESAPAIEASSFPAGAVINGPTAGPFTRQQATTLAVLVSSGPLPVAFTAVDISTVTPVSARGGPNQPAAGPRRPELRRHSARGQFEGLVAAGAR